MDNHDEGMNEEILSPDRLRALLAAFKERHGAEYRLCALGYGCFGPRLLPSQRRAVVRHLPQRYSGTD